VLAPTTQRSFNVKAKALIVTALGALALAVPASGASPRTVDHFHNVFTDSANVCGIDVAETEAISGVFTIVGNGVEINAYSIQNTWTNPANGKSVDFHAAVLNKDTFASPTDNGDGTVSFFLKASGMEQVKANGALLMFRAGQMTGVLTLNATTFDFVSFRVVSEGGRPPNADYCPAVVAALT
jgi:hypothetical protein